MSAFAGFRFPREVIAVAVRWYLGYNPSYRYAEELLVEQGIRVDHVKSTGGTKRFAVKSIEAARPCRRLLGDPVVRRQTDVKVTGRWSNL